MPASGRTWARYIGLALIAAIIAFFLANPKAYSYLRYGPKVINGLGAKLLCSGVFVAGRDAQAVFEEDVLTSHALAQYSSFDINQQTEEVTVNSYGLFTQKAKYNPDFGCSLYHNEAPSFSAPEISQQTGFQWDEVEVNQDIQGILDSIIAENSSKPHIDSRALIVAKQGKIIAEAYAPGYDQSSQFLSWSMAKSITSSLVGIWLEENGQDIDQPPGFSEWENDERKNIQLRHLLNMASGLKFDESYEPGDNATRMLFFEDNMAHYARTAAAEIEAAPGEKFVYSSGTTNILSGWLFDKLGGTENYYRFAQEKLFLPSGITGATYEPDASGSFVGSSYLYMTARQWAKFGQLYLQRGNLNGQQIIPEHWVDFVKTPIKAAPRGEYGGQFWLNAGAADDSSKRMFKDLPSDLYLASGHNGQYVVIIPSRELVIVRLGWANGERFDLNGHFAKILAAL
ncbi:MAG: beta-lactamase family protein [Cellvibrionaceae bacterium]|nr:beta-lactamase family protein [Cellvibrionaceae bacterium]